MNISIIIPQVFYDFIARILPGVFFSILALLSFPEWTGYLSPLALSEKTSFMQSLGQGVLYAALCYFLGWLFFAFSPGTMRDESRRKYQNDGDSKSLNAMYQWIRLSHPPAGFRIVKLRAEARMFQATRTGMIVIVVLAVAYVTGLLLFLSPPPWPPDRVFWMRPSLGVLIAIISFLGFRKCEAKAWNYYWSNVRTVYDLLHDTADPVNRFAASRK
ncbi:MAG: hypothetical protein WC378_09160 [Opitutaceae bacterium]|jgi:hypothetical protein